MCTECGKQLINSKKSSNACPYCREPNFTLTPDKFISRQIQGLQVVCHNSRRGCPWTGELRALKHHIEETCEKNFANFAKCEHCLFKCPHKAFPDHKRICTEAPLPCPNTCKAKTVKRKDLKWHLEKDCSLRVIGEGTLPHTANQLVETAPLAVTMTNFSHYVKTGRTWHSPPFYTHRNGYKVCLRVDANLWKKGYISVLVCVLKGDHDKTLNWPLRAKIEVALYNWKTNKSLYNKILYLPGDFFCLANTTDLLASWGKGLVEFISHKSLSSDQAEYVRFDCINFQIGKVTFVKAPVIPKVPEWAGNKCFIVPHFQYMKQNDIIFYGPRVAIPTDKGSYQLCPRVDSNGYGAGKGSCVSVSCIVTKGEHDNVLSWPIEADIIVEMLNWRENKNHKYYTISLSYGANLKASQVPVNGIGELPWGNPSFATHSSLSHNHRTNTQFLDQGCLLFKVHSFTLYSDVVSAKKLPPWVNPAVGSSYPCFTISEFTKRKAFNNRYYSNAFSSHYNGYKMQISVQAAKGESIGLHLYLMKGPNDHQLQWPFQGDVVVELTNWRSDKGHHSKMISLSSKCTNTVCDRVLTNDRGTDSWGYENFISHQSLPFNPETNTEYLQKDCLHFRIKEVAVHSSPTLFRVPEWQTQRHYFQFTINNFTRRAKLNADYISPAFYTHRGGYKMRLEVKVKEKSKDVSVYARFLKGENDAALSWPLTADIFIELLNWRADRNHHSYTINFHERVANKYRNRVEIGNGAADSWGNSSFMPCSQLGYNPSTNTEYINGDCLCFRVKVAAYSSALTGKVPRWQPHDQPASFTITDIAERRDMGNKYYSPPFYASQYKMCLSVYVGGCGTQKGNHVSVFACLLKGEHDDVLEWPFRGDITVEVLNWRGDQGHFKNVLSLDEYDVNTDRVKTEEMAPAGFGLVKFMPISRTYQYIEDQCMRMCVSRVACYNSPLRSKFPKWQDSVLHGLWNSAGSNSLLEFTITDFSIRLDNGTIYYSQPFYIHKKGYKMRLEVTPKGTGKYTGHMSVYARLMAGEYDSSLKWPMKIDLTVEMVNWTRNSNHVSEIIKFGHTDIDGCRRVPQEEKTSPTRWGVGKFCSHAVMLGGRQYIQEDCVRMRVKGAIVYSTKFLGVF